MQHLLETALASPATGIVVTVLVYLFGHWCGARLKTPLANPLLIAVLTLALLIRFTPLTPESYRRGGDLVALFLPIATAALAISIYRRLQVLRRSMLPILIGCGVGAMTAIGSVYGLCSLFGLTDQLRISLLPKSVTTPIAIELAALGGGVPAIAVAGVVITGITGVVIAPMLLKLLRSTDPIEQGIAIGTSSHALGTGKALEMGELQGAMSSISIGVTGLYTVLFLMLVH